MILEIFLVWLIWYLVTTYIERRSMPPGPFPLPLIGNITAVLSAKPLNKLKQKYGDIFTLDLLEKTVVVSTASLAREARVSNKDDVAGRSIESIYPLNVIFGRNDVGFSDYGTPYLFRKRVFKLAMHVFGSGIIKQKNEEAMQLTLHWKR